MGSLPNGRERSHGAPWRGENIDNHIYFMLCRFWLYKNMPKYFKNLFRSLGGQCRHQRPSKTLTIYSTQWKIFVSPSCIAFLTYYMPIYMWGSWWWGSYGGGRRCTKLPFWGLFNTPPPTYLNPTKCFEPTSSDYTRP